MKAVMAADLFCGAGGTSTGLAQACDELGRSLRLAAVNHWELKRIEAGIKKFCGELARPFLMLMSQSGSNGDRLRPVEVPLNTITTADDLALVTPFVVPTNYGERPGQAPRTHDPSRPLPTVTATASHALVEPFLLPHRQFDGMQVDSIRSPLRTITAHNGGDNALVEPFLVPFYANGQADPVGDPLRTVTTRDRHALVQPDAARLDIRFRMLQPHELAAAMGFPAGYVLTGNRAEQVRQIGNAVEVNTARALCLAMLENN